MKIKITDIGFAKRTFHGQFSPDLIGQREQDELRFVTPLSIRAEAERCENNMVVVHTFVEGQYKAICGSCLEEFQKLWTYDYFQEFEINRNTVFIDLTEHIRQEVMIELPQRVVCRDDCIVLCRHCGINLNEETCSCDETSESEEEHDSEDDNDQTYQPFANLKLKPLPKDQK